MSRYLSLKGVPIGTLRLKYILYGYMEPWGLGLGVDRA